MTKLKKSKQVEKETISDTKDVKHNKVHHKEEPHLLQDVKHTIDQCIDSSTTFVYGTMGNVSTSIQLTQELFSELSKVLSRSLEQHMKLGNNLLECRTVSDVVEFQKVLFETSFSNAMTNYTDFSNILSSHTNKMLKQSNASMGKSVQCMLH